MVKTVPTETGHAVDVVEQTRSAGRSLRRSFLNERRSVMSSTSDTDPIEVSLGKRGGEPVFRGTRIPIAFLSQYLSHGYSVEDFIEEYDIGPELVREVYEQKFSGEDEQGHQVSA